MMLVIYFQMVQHGVCAHYASKLPSIYPYLPIMYLSFIIYHVSLYLSIIYLELANMLKC